VSQRISNTVRTIAGGLIGLALASASGAAWAQDPVAPPVVESPQPATEPPAASEQPPAETPPAEPPAVEASQPEKTEESPSQETPPASDTPASDTQDDASAPAEAPSATDPTTGTTDHVVPDPPSDPGPQPLASVGYADTPEIQGSPWRIHDLNRPRPRSVTPQYQGDAGVPGAPPSDAVILFDGKDLSRWRTWGESSSEQLPAQWTLVDGCLEVKPGAGRLVSIDTFGDCQLHLEFQCPLTDVDKQSQERGNSGVFVMGLYEFQVLDMFENFTYADGQVGAIYAQEPPLVNAALPTGVWQSYDIIFETPRFDGEQLIKPAIATVLLNGVLVQNHRELHGPTRHKTPGLYRPHPPGGPIMLQDHGSLVRYRNIWVRPLRWDD
jgi:hypothetical protein